MAREKKDREETKGRGDVKHSREFRIFSETAERVGLSAPSPYLGCLQGTGERGEEGRGKARLREGGENEMQLIKNGKRTTPRRGSRKEKTAASRRSGEKEVT